MSNQKEEETTEETIEETTEETTEETSEDDGKNELTAAQARIKELETKNSELEARPAPRTAPVAAPVSLVTADSLEELDETAQEKLSEQYGMPFKTIVNKIRATERATASVATQKTAARANVREAIEDLADRDPQAGKLKKGIREYFDAQPDSVKADPTEMEKHMKFAVNYAKGSAGTLPARKKAEPEPKVGEPGADVDGDDKDAIATGVHEMKGFKIRIDEMPKELADQIKHPDRREGVRIPSDFDKEPVWK